MHWRGLDSAWLETYLASPHAAATATLLTHLPAVPSGLGYGGKLLPPLGEDILLSWVAIVMMTLKTVGVPPYAEGEARLASRGSSELTESTSRMTLGLQMFVKQSLDLFLSGTSLHRLQLQQSMAGVLGAGERVFVGVGFWVGHCWRGGEACAAQVQGQRAWEDTGWQLGDNSTAGSLKHQALQ